MWGSCNLLVRWIRNSQSLIILDGEAITSIGLCVLSNHLQLACDGQCKSRSLIENCSDLQVDQNPNRMSAQDKVVGLWFIQVLSYVCLSIF